MARAAASVATWQTIGMVLPQEQADKNKAPSLQAQAPPRQEQEGSAGECPWASHVRDRLAVLSIKGRPHQISGVARQEQEAPLLKVLQFLVCAMTVLNLYIAFNERRALDDCNSTTTSYGSC